MVAYVGFAQRDEWADWAQVYARHAARFEEVSGHPCLVVPFGLAGTDLVEKLQPEAVVLSGFARSFEEYSTESFEPVASWVLAAVATPTLAICGAHQLVASVFNGELHAGGQLRDRPMRPRRPGEPITNPDYHPEYYMERGFYELTVLGEDGLFAGCSVPPVVWESHYCEVKQVPPSFRVLASTPDCTVQAMRHSERPLVCVQFHPEDYTERFADGRTILTNFFRSALSANAPDRMPPTSQPNARSL